MSADVGGIARQFRRDRFAQRGQTPADGDFDALAAVDDVREDAATERFAVEARDRIFGALTGARAQPSVARPAGATRIDRQREDGKTERGQQVEARACDVTRSSEKDHGAYVAADRRGRRTGSNVSSVAAASSGTLSSGRA